MTTTFRTCEYIKLTGTVVESAVAEFRKKLHQFCHHGLSVKIDVIPVSTLVMLMDGFWAYTNWNGIRMSDSISIPLNLTNG